MRTGLKLSKLRSIQSLLDKNNGKLLRLNLWSSKWAAVSVISKGISFYLPVKRLDTEDDDALSSSVSCQFFVECQTRFWIILVAAEAPNRGGVKRITGPAGFLEGVWPPWPPHFHGHCLVAVLSSNSCFNQTS